MLNVFFHILGFQHEINRPDRDSYIKIDFDHIDPNKVFVFSFYL